MADSDLFHVTTRVNGKTTEFQLPIYDPLLRHTVHTEWRLISWLPFPRLRWKTEVIIGTVGVDVDRAVMRAIHQVAVNRAEATEGSPLPRG